MAYHLVSLGASEADFDADDGRFALAHPAALIGAIVMLVVASGLVLYQMQKQGSGSARMKIW